MKHVTAKSPDHNDDNQDTLTDTTTEPFAENRNSKYRFERESIVINAPGSPGVYGLYSALWIFIGEAENIKARLLEHLAGDNPCINQHQPSGFAFELVSPDDRGRRRDELLDELAPICKNDRSRNAPAHDAGPEVSAPSVYASALNDKIRLRRENDK